MNAAYRILNAISFLRGGREASTSKVPLIITMKKFLTILAVAAAFLSGKAQATLPAPVYTLSDVNIATAHEYNISDLRLDTTTGYTLMLTVNWTSRGNGTLLWLSNKAGEAANSGGSLDRQLHSTATIGYSTGTNKFAITYGDGGSGGGTHTLPPSSVTLPSHTQPASTDVTVTLFLTSQGGTATVYELASDGKLYQTSTRNNYATGDVATLSIGNWATSRTTVQTGTMNAAIFSGVLTAQQMADLIPEPTTATLSLLALAAMAARRRRH